MHYVYCCTCGLSPITGDCRRRGGRRWATRGDGAWSPLCARSAGLSVHDADEPTTTSDSQARPSLVLSAGVNRYSVYSTAVSPRAKYDGTERERLAIAWVSSASGTRAAKACRDSDYSLSPSSPNENQAGGGTPKLSAMTR